MAGLSSRHRRAGAAVSTSATPANDQMPCCDGVQHVTPSEPRRGLESRQRTPDVVIVAVAGEIEQDTSAEVRQIMIDVLRGERPAPRQLGHGSVAFLDSAGIKALLSCRRNAQQLDSRIEKRQALDSAPGLGRHRTRRCMGSADTRLNLTPGRGLITRAGRRRPGHHLAVDLHPDLSGLGRRPVSAVPASAAFSGCISTASVDAVLVRLSAGWLTTAPRARRSVAPTRRDGDHVTPRRSFPQAVLASSASCGVPGAA